MKQTLSCHQLQTVKFNLMAFLNPSVAHSVHKTSLILVNFISLILNFVLSKEIWEIKLNVLSVCEDKVLSYKYSMFVVAQNYLNSSKKSRCGKILLNPK